MLIAGTGVLGQRIEKGLPPLRGDGREHAGVGPHLKSGQRGGREAAPCVGVAVGVGQIGFDIQNRSAVHEVGAAYMQNGPQRGVRFDSLQAHGGQADGVGPKRRPRGKYAHAPVAAQLGRPYRGRPVPAHALGKLPDQPQMAEAFQPPKGVRIAVFRLEHHARRQAVHQPALARDAEFRAKIAADARDDTNRHALAHGWSSSSLVSSSSTSDRLRMCHWLFSLTKVAL